MRNSPVEPAGVPAQAPQALMEVQVHFYGIRKELMDAPYVELQVPHGASLRTVLHALVERFGEGMRRRVFSADGAYLRASNKTLKVVQK